MLTHFLALVWFHLKSYARNSYFVTLPLLNVFSIILLQYLFVYADISPANTTIWLKAALFGMWSVVTTSAGMIGYQRYQGTLLYLLGSSMGDRLSLWALLLSPTLFSLVAFPLAYAMGEVLGLPLSGIDGLFMLHLTLFWLAAVVIGALLAVFSVLTPHAIIYEQLIHIPLLLLSGLFTIPMLTPVVAPIRWILPIASAITLLLGQSRAVLYCQYTVSLLLLTLVLFSLSGYLLSRARRDGQLGMM